MARKKDKENISFDDALKEMEEIVERLEREDVSLDDSIALYEKGIRLHGQCAAMLSKARLRIEELTKKADSQEDIDSVDESEESGEDSDGDELPF